jgi:hypothetical protein
MAFQAFRREDEIPARRSTARSGSHSRARSTARSRAVLSRPGGKGLDSNRNPDARSNASSKLTTAPRTRTRRRSFRTSACSCLSFSSRTSRLITSCGPDRSHPAAVERGTPSLVATLRSPVTRTSSRSLWSYVL